MHNRWWIPSMSRYQAIRDQFHHSRLLFGDPAERGIVAVEIAPPREVEIFRRTDGKIVRERRPLKLFTILSDRELLEEFKGTHEIAELKGDFRFRCLATFGAIDVLEAAKRHLRRATGKPPGAPDAPYFVLNDPVEQHLMLTGATFFMGIEFTDLHRMQLDIETYISPGFEFPSAAREGDRVIAIAIADSTGFERVLSGAEMDERAMLNE